MYGIDHYIGGTFSRGSGTRSGPVFNPSTGEQIGEVPLSAPETSTRAVESCVRSRVHS